MAQLVARLVRNEKVGGSNPPSSTNRNTGGELMLSARFLFARSPHTGCGITCAGAARPYFWCLSTR